MKHPELVADFERLRETCIELRVLSNEFKRLFSVADKPTLDATGPVVFQRIHYCMIEVWWLRVGRLMDPAKSSGRENLSIRNICDRLQRQFGTDPKIDRVDQAILAIWDKMKNARNKQVAHSDLEASRGDTWLGTLSEGDEDDIENSMQELCDLIGNKLGAGPLDYRASGCKGDASDLLGFLEFGLRARDAWQRARGHGKSIRGMYRDETDR